MTFQPEINCNPKFYSLQQYEVRLSLQHLTHNFSYLRYESFNIQANRSESEYTIAFQLYSDNEIIMALP